MKQLDNKLADEPQSPLMEVKPNKFNLETYRDGFCFNNLGIRAPIVITCQI